jgi:acyl-[acyl-carrier-protein]-phospholipid O-acyltransferase/long-chain-fatty-acid--[acyl-carrier-protein] ligase
VLVTEKREATRSAFQAHAKQRGAADLMIPGEVLVLDKLPVLGSGKLDHVAVTRLARERAAAPAPVAAA